MIQTLENQVSVKTRSAGFVLFATAVAAIGGFLFGNDTAVINGANAYLQAHFGLNPDRDAFWIGLATTAAIYGCVPGAMAAGFFSDRFGRRRVLFFCALLYALSVVLLALPQTLGQFVAARFLVGNAIGISSMISTAYIAEIAPASWRGRLGSCRSASAKPKGARWSRSNPYGAGPNPFPAHDNPGR